MAVTGNILSEINDEVIFTMDYPLNGITSISAYTDGVTGVTGTRLFEKEFRYTLDGVNWGIWEELGNGNLSAIPIEATHTFQAQFKYKRVGTDATGNLVFEWLKLDYETAVDCSTGSGAYFQGSIFSYFFDCCCDDDIKKWCINVLDKMYKPGIVSKSLTRGENANKNFEDEDYIAFWKTVSCFFSMHVNYARGFETFDTDTRLLAAYLTNQSIIVNRDETIPDMQYMMANLYSFTRHRGTPAIGNLKSRGATVDGELANLVQFEETCDELILEYSPLIWTLDQHSPLYKGIDKIRGRKSYQTDLLDIDLNNYPTLPTGSVVVADLGAGDENVISISGMNPGEKAGIGFIDPLIPTEAEKEFLISVNPLLAYEINFLAKGDSPFTVGAYGYSSSGAVASVDTIDPSLQTRYAISRQKLAQSNEWYLVRVLILPGGALFSGSTQNINTSLGLGYNLRMPAQCCKMAFEITADRTTPSNNEPTVTDTEVNISARDIYTFTIADFTENYNDAEGDPFGGVTIDAIAIASGGGLLGDLKLNGATINGSLPTPVSADEIATGLLTYEDAGAVTIQDVEIDFTVLDNQPQSSDGRSALYIKDVVFKLLNRPYGIGVVNGVNLVETWVKNNSGLSEEQVDEKIKQSLIPYNTKNKNNYLS